MQTALPLLRAPLIPHPFCSLLVGFKSDVSVRGQFRQLVSLPQTVSAYDEIMPPSSRLSWHTQARLLLSFPYSEHRMRCVIYFTSSHTHICVSQLQPYISFHVIPHSFPVS
jgi:hypothetical protein